MLPNSFIELTGYCYGNRALIRLNDIIDVWEHPSDDKKESPRNPPTWINTIHVQTPFQVKESYGEVLRRMRVATPA